MKKFDEQKNIENRARAFFGDDYEKIDAFMQGYKDAKEGIKIDVTLYIMLVLVVGLLAGVILAQNF